MNKHEVDEFATLWIEPDPAEQEVFKSLARKARRKGRLLAYVDAAQAVLLVAPLLTVFMTPHPIMIALAVPLLVATAWLIWTRRRLRQMTATLNTSDPVAFLESSVRNATANLRRLNLSLTLTLPFILTAVLFKGSQRSGGSLDHLPVGIWTWGSSPRGLVALAIVALFTAGLVRSRRRTQEELRRLELLRLDYEEERRRDEAA